MLRTQNVIIIGPFPIVGGVGGISSVISTFLSHGTFDGYRIDYIWTSYPGNLLQKIVTVLLAVCKLLFRLVSEDVALLHIHTASWLSFYRKTLFIFIGKAFRKKVVLHIHGGQFNIFYESGPSLNRWLIKKALDTSDAILVLSEAWIEHIKSKTNNVGLIVIPNPVNTSEFISLLDRPRNNNEPKNIIYLGGIHASKGVFDLLNIVAVVATIEPCIRLHLCGDGNNDNIRMLCEQYGIAGKVKFCGWVTGQEKISMMADADVFVLPSYYEAFPVSIIEAMAAGLPIVSTNVGGIPDIVKDGINGFLVNPGDIEAMSDGILRVLCDAPLRERMGKLNALQARTLYDVNVVSKQICRVYQKLLTES